ncbi:hypothetical protein [Lacticaseibacillus hegangensis]|uniref:DUF2922 family protein n=1 Tax=Lacticaseibacillus hegangensis TaxID=2486010 RepID=A0ABW4CYJ3_9LACO|nr:hypothetical protein [Lacticaseibacillus hegangensis]
MAKIQLRFEYTDAVTKRNRKWLSLTLGEYLPEEIDKKQLAMLAKLISDSAPHQGVHLRDARLIATDHDNIMND